MSRLRDRFDGATSEEMQRFSSSLDDDLPMADEDVDGSIAHATMLAECGILTKDEGEQLRQGLERIREELHAGSWKPSAADEDIHMAIERRLGELVGDVAGKLHTARSRNDQVATDVRLWLKRRLPELRAAVSELIDTLLDRVARDGKTLVPGYTHLQRGQPILLGHQILAHAWSLARDRDRLRDAAARADRCPLGAGAMAGTPHPIDRDRTAELLGFAAPVDNAMDAVSARDHLQEIAAACAILMTHLSRMSEELVLWSSSEFGLVRLSEEFATGSSIMPQKRNPDAAEIVRGKSAAVHGDVVVLLGLTRGLPLAYNRDLQEDRRPLFHAVTTSYDCVRIMAGVWRGLEVRHERFEDELRGDFSLATELADLLVARGVSFREAHGIVGRIVRWCETEGCDLDALTPEIAAGFHPKLSEGIEPYLDPRAAAERRTSRGGTAWTEIERQVTRLRELGRD